MTSSYGSYIGNEASSATQSLLPSGVQSRIGSHCDTGSARSSYRRGPDVSKIILAIAGIVVAVSLCYMAVNSNLLRQDIDTIANSTSTAPGIGCPACECSCPQAPDCSLTCPAAPECKLECPDPADVVCEAAPACPQCPTYSLECPDQDDDHTCPSVKCRECGDCIGGKVTHNNYDDDDDDDSSSSHYGYKKRSVNADVCFTDTCNPRSNVKNGKIELSAECLECTFN